MDPTPGNKPTWRRLSFAIVLCGAILLLAAIPGVNAPILQLDRTAAFTLNGVIGKSAVLDHLILALADRKADERALAVILIGFAIFVAMAPTRRKRAERFSLFLFLFVATSLTLVAQEQIDDVVRRRSPSYDLRPFHNIELLYHDKVKIRQGESFPSEHGVGYFLIGFVLLRLGSMGGLFFLGAGAILPLAGCAVGSEWLSDTYLGALPLGFLCSALLVDTRVFYVKTYFGRQLLLALDKVAIGIRSKKHLLDGSFRWSTQNVYRVEAATKRYIMDNLDSLSGKSSVEQIRVEMPLAGVRSIVRFITLDDVRFVLRVYPVVRRIEAELHKDASDMLAAHGINAPRIIEYSDEPSRYGVVLIAEEFIIGSSLRAEEMTRDHIVSLARQLAKLHSVHNAKWGPLRSPREGKHFIALRKRIHRYMKLAAEKNFGLQEKREIEILAWFDAWAPQFDSLPYFSLTHNKLHHENCIFAEGDEYYFLDFTTLEWAVPAKDIVKVYHLLLQDDQQKIQTFNSHYFENISADDRAIFRKFHPFYEALFHLTSAATQAKRSTRGAISPETHIHEKLQFAISRLLQVAGEQPDAEAESESNS
jgi:hypothetical protein